jgi:hypothetical protein
MKKLRPRPSFSPDCFELTFRLQRSPAVGNDRLACQRQRQRRLEKSSIWNLRRNGLKQVLNAQLWSLEDERADLWWLAARLGSFFLRHTCLSRELTQFVGDQPFGEAGNKGPKKKFRHVDR